MSLSLGILRGEPVDMTKNLADCFLKLALYAVFIADLHSAVTKIVYAGNSPTIFVDQHGWRL